MESFLIGLCIVSTSLISLQLHTMDNDNAIPLKTISQKPISLHRQFQAFEQKLSIELNEDSLLLKKTLSPTEYIERLNKELPLIFSSSPTIEKLSRIQNSYFAKYLNQLINNQGYNHYKNVTGDTLATIHIPKAKQACPILNHLPVRLKKYIMKKAYQTIEQNLACVAFNQYTTIHDIHANTSTAASIDRNSKIFQLWNLRTGTLTREIPNASDISLVRFSVDGSILVTTNSLPQDVTITYINLWKIETRELIMTLKYSNKIKNLFFKNNILHVIEETGYLYTAHLDIHKKEIKVLTRINAGIQTTIPLFTSQGKYHIHHNQILQKSFFYFLCAQAIKNTSRAVSLKEIYNTEFYTSDSLTNDQRKMLHKKIESKLKKLEPSIAQPHHTMSLFG